MSKELIVLVQSIEQPRVIKRIIDLSASYDKVYIAGFVRSFYIVNNSSVFDKYPSIHILDLYSIDNNRFLFRVLSYIKFILFLNFGIGQRFNEIYCFGLDVRILVYFSRKSIVRYEISDISWLYFSKLFRMLFSKIDCVLCKLSQEVIFTSRGFYERYYQFLPDDKICIIENRFRPFGSVFPLQTLKTDRIRVAYVGAFRYPNLINILLEFFKLRSNLDIRFYGDGYSDVVAKIKDSSESYPNIYFFGPFKNPTDLEDIYSENNLNFVAYDTSTDNEKVAMPNKFYESGYFNIPIVVSKETYVEERVQEVGLGWSIEPNEQGIKDFFDSLTVGDLLEVHERIKLMDKKQFTED